MKLVSIIIVTWNGLHWLKKSLPSLKKVIYRPFEIILVDNSSTDGTIEWVRKNYPNVTIVMTEVNVGYAEANNRGFQVSKGEYVLFLNNDVKVTPMFLSELINAVNTDSTIAGAQSKILLMERTDTYDTIGAFLTSTGFLYHYCFMNVDQKKFDNQINIFTPKGACMLFKRSALNKVLVQNKLFDSDAFAYFEETDMAQRIWLSGKRIIYVPNSVIFHKMGGTSTTMNNSFIQYHSFKNRIATYVKNLSVQSLLTLLPVHIICCEIYALIYISRGKILNFIAIQKALLWNVKNLTKTLKKRRFIQHKIRKVPDSTYFRLVFRNPPVNFYIAQAQGNVYKEQDVL